MNAEDVPKWVVVLGIIAFVGAAVALGLDAFAADLTANSYAYNITTTMLTAVDNMVAQMPTIGTIIGIGLLVGIVVGAFWLFGTQATGGKKKR